MKNYLIVINVIIGLGILGCNSKKIKDLSSNPTPAIKPVNSNSIPYGTPSPTISPRLLPSPAGRYYKPEKDILILGDWDGKDKFTPVEPPQTIDVSKSYPISPRYPILVPNKKVSRRHINKDGKTIERTWDPETGEVQEYEVTSSPTPPE